MEPTTSSAAGASSPRSSFPSAAGPDVGRLRNASSVLRWLGGGAGYPLHQGDAAVHDAFADPHAAVLVFESARSVAGSELRDLAAQYAPRKVPTAVLAVTPGGLAMHVRSTLGEPVTVQLPSRGADDELLDALRALRDASPAIGVLEAHRLLLRRDVSSRFFRDVRRALAGVSASWTGLATDTAAMRHSLSIHLLCRLMFVGFIEQKGWVPARLVASVVLDPERQGLHRALTDEVFAPLNTPPEARTTPSPLPYLNGGLFDVAMAERANPGAVAGNDALRALVADVLERYRLVHRRDGDGVGIDPVMLGRVFEGLMAPDERQATGTFYTPPALVARVVDDALCAHFGALPGDDGFHAVDAAQLDAVRVLDPAVGSGAFLLGVLDRLVDARVARMGESAAYAARHVLTHNLYGVDVSETAVTICELRLWLALVTRLDAPAPLPNLGRRIRHGHALLGGWRRSSAAPSAALRELGARYAAAHGGEKARLERALTDAEQMAHRDVLRAALRAAEERRDALSVRSGDLFEVRARRSDTSRAAAAAVDAAAVALARCERGEHAGAFELAAHFGHVIDEGGFSIVVGNPPWVRLSHVDPLERRAIREHYRWMSPIRRPETAATLPLPHGQRQSDGAPQCVRVAASEHGAPSGVSGSTAGGFATQADLSVAFVELAVRCTRPGGAVALVVPSKLLTAGYGAAMRAGLMAEAPPRVLRDLSRRGTMHFAADVTPAVLVAARCDGTDVIVDDGNTETALPLTHLAATDPGAAWPLIDRDARVRIAALQRHAPPLRDRYAIRLGVKTGFNQAFLDPPLMPERTPAVRGADLAAFHVKQSRGLLFAHDRTTGEPLRQPSPQALAHLGCHTDRLAARVDGRSPLPHEIFRVGPPALGHRVAFRDIDLMLQATYLPPVAAGGPVALNTCYTIAVGSAAEGRRLAAWLNAEPVRAVAAALADHALGGYKRFQARNVGAVPLPPAVEFGHQPLQQLADRLHATSGADLAAASALNRLAAELLGEDGAHATAERAS